jgi:hypothetical protein
VNTLVFSLETLAVTEYTTAFTGLSGDIECVAGGVCQVGTDKDLGVNIVSAVSFGLALNDGRGAQQRPQHLYVHGNEVRQLRASVSSAGGHEYSYSANHWRERVVRFNLGKGLRAAYLKFGLTNSGYLPFVIDSIDFEPVASGQRRL